jgi:predicted Zn finger-like uncharacterized protein
MKISCGSCGAKYTVSDEKVHGKTVKVKCRKCSAVIVVSSTGEVQTTGGSSAGASASVGGDVTYTVSVSDTDQRSMTMAEIVKAYNEGGIDAETYVWAEGMDDWQPLKDVDVIVDALHQAAQPGEAAQEGGLDRTVAIAGAGAYDYAAARPAAQPMAAASGDHFGASTVALSSPYDSGPAARPAASSGGGFFAVSAPTAAAAPTGKENSAIFSLDMLTAKVGAPSSSASSGSSEDSGLIDLKALASGMGDGGGGGIAAQHGPTAEVFPLGAPPPVQAIAAPSLAPTQSGGTSRGLILALFGAVVVLGAALVFVVMSRSDDKTTAPTASTTPSTPDTSTPAAPPTDTVATPSTASTTGPETTAGTADTGKVALGGPPPKIPPGGGGKNPPPPPGGGGKTQPPPPPPKGGGGACGCAQDDLMCHMRCTSKKK